MAFAADIYCEATQMNQGTFAKHELLDLIKNGRITPSEFYVPDHVDVASFNIGASREIYEVERLISPGGPGEKVRDLLPFMNHRRVPYDEPLLVGKTYLSPSISLNLPPGIYARMNAKSTTGRLFCHVRTMSDKAITYDLVDRRNIGYTGEVWLVIQPLVVPIILSPTECLSQIRISNAKSKISDEELRELLLSHNLLLRRDGQSYDQGSLSHFSHDGSFITTLFAKGIGPIGYSYKTGVNFDPIKLSDRNIDPSKYFDKVYAETYEAADKSLGSYMGVTIRRMTFYLLATNEVVNIPLSHSCELLGIDRNFGDIFTHYAGFFDPGFCGTGTLEIFSHMDVVMRHKQPFARFMLELMRSSTSSYGKGSSYQGQIKAGPSKQFAAFV